MGNLAYKVLNPLLKTRKRFIIVTLLITFIVSSVIYVANNHWYYNSIEFITKNQSKHYKQTIKLIDATITGNQRNTLLKKALQDYIETCNGRITITYYSGSQQMWHVYNNKRIDKNRTQVFDSEMINKSNSPTDYLEYRFQKSVKPKSFDGLVRAWSWSFADLIKVGIDKYKQRGLHQRSLPFYTYFLILLFFIYIAGFVIKSVYTRNKMLASLNSEMNNVIQGFTNQVEDKEKLLKTTKDMLDNKDAEIEDVNLSIQKHPDTSNMQNDELDSLKAKLDKLSEERENLRVEHDLLSKQIEIDQKTITEFQEQYSIASSKLKDSEMEILRLMSLVNKLQNDPGFSNFEKQKEYKEIIAQLDKWVKRADKSKCKTSGHGTKGLIDEFIKKLKCDFVESYFDLVTNSKYDSYHLKTITIGQQFNNEKNGDKKGILIVTLPNDKGCSVSMQYTLRKNAPDKYVGFLMALLLQCHRNKLLNDYTLHVN